MQLRAVALAVPLIVIAGIAAADPTPTPPPASTAVPAPSVPLAGPPPNMAPGLWEWTILQKSNSSTPTPDEIARLPPDVQARIKANMERAKEPHTLQACLTGDSLRHGFSLQHDNNRVCTRQVVASNANLFEERIECHGKADTMKSHITMSVIDRHTTDGMLEMELLIPKFGKDQTATGHIAGKFLTADCGFTKP